MKNIRRITLRPGKDESVRRFHPWIFSGAIIQADQPDEGEVVEVYSSRNEYLGTGHYQKGSIAVRLFTFRQAEPDEAFWLAKLNEAFALRKITGVSSEPHTNVYRLIHGEGDGFPGLIADFYNGTLVLQAHSVGMFYLLDQLATIIMKHFGHLVRAVYNKSSHSVPFKAGLDAQDGFLTGSDPVVEVSENGNRYLVNVETGQKTGFFIDQRDNRKRVETLANGKKVLNLFSYSGGFSVAALRGGAVLAHSVDSSAGAIELAEQNVALNFGPDAPHQAFCEEVYDYMKNPRDEYDLIVVDPPAFAKHINAVGQALKGYRRVNQKAIQLVKPGGLVFTFSCSQVVSRNDFRLTIFSAAAMSGRNVRIIDQFSQPADHPVSIYHPEGEYLKGLLLHVS